MAKKDFPPNYMDDDNGTIRIKKHEFDFAEATGTMFHPLRQNSRSNEVVMLHLIETISRILQISKKKSCSDVLFRHAELMLEATRESFQRSTDIEEAVKRFEKCQTVYQQSVERFKNLALSDDFAHN